MPLADGLYLALASAKGLLGESSTVCDTEVHGQKDRLIRTPGRKRAMPPERILKLLGKGSVHAETADRSKRGRDYS